jgi:histidyl-tRNA synthetase
MILTGKKAQLYLDIQNAIRRIYAEHGYVFYKPFTMTDQEDEISLYAAHGAENESKFIFTTSGQFLIYDHTPQLGLVAKKNEHRQGIYTIGPVFRCEVNDTSHWVEFTQCDADILYATDPVLDTAKSLRTAFAVLREFNIHFFVKIFAKNGNMKQLEEIQKQLPEEKINIDVTLHRSAEYYSGPVFEGYWTYGDGHTALFGGGYYPIRFKGEVVCHAVGFALSIERLLFNSHPGSPSAFAH